MSRTPIRTVTIAILAVLALPVAVVAELLKLHAVFSDHMVIQRDKAITIWGWGQPGRTIHVKLGDETARAEVGEAVHVEVFGMSGEYAGKGRWEVALPAREASADPATLQVTDGVVTLEVKNILIGDVWVLYGQSNMAWPLARFTGSDMARAQADLPLAREFKIQGNEQASQQDDIRPDALAHGGWLYPHRKPREISRASATTSRPMCSARSGSRSVSSTPPAAAHRSRAWCRPASSPRIRSQNVTRSMWYDPAASAVDRGAWRAIQDEAQERLEHRRAEEAGRAVEIHERIKKLGEFEQMDEEETRVLICINFGVKGETTWDCKQGTT